MVEIQLKSFEIYYVCDSFRSNSTFCYLAQIEVHGQSFSFTVTVITTNSSVLILTLQATQLQQFSPVDRLVILLTTAKKGNGNEKARMESSKLPSQSSSSNDSDNDGKKHLMYNYRGKKVLKHKRQVADKKLVKKSILLFEAGNEDADYLKGVLVESAKKHKLDNEHDRGLKKKSTGTLKKKKGKKPKSGERSRQRKDTSSLSSPKQRKKTPTSAKLKEKTDKNDGASRSKSPKKDKVLKKKITKDTVTSEQQRTEQEELQVQQKQQEQDQRYQKQKQNKQELAQQKQQQQKHEDIQKRADAVKEKLNNSLNSLQSLISGEGGHDSTSSMVASESMPTQAKSPRQQQSSTLNSTSPRTTSTAAASDDRRQTHSDDDNAEIISNPWLQQSPKSPKQSSIAMTEQVDDLASPELTSMDRDDDSPEENQLQVQSQHSTMTAEESRQGARDALAKVSSHTQNLEMVEDVAVDTMSFDGNDEDTEQPPPHWNGSLSEFVDVKRSLWKFLDNNDECTETMTKPLVDKYGIDHEDVELAVEHIRFAQIYNNGIRWDLIGSLFFPESYVDDDVGVKVSHLNNKNNNNGQNQNEQQRRQRNSAHVPENEHEKSLPEISEEMLNDMEEEDVVEEEIVDDGSSLSLREGYQEVILDVYEAMEDVLSSLPPRDAAVRQQALIHLLRATSEDETHLTTLSLDDLHEIISHFELCLEHGIESLEWSMVEEIVFPLGMSEHDPCSNSSNVDLGDEELEAVLNHINLAAQQGEDIRWDLVAEILFPCDPVFQKILGGDNTTNNSSNNGDGDGDGGGKSSSSDVGPTNDGDAVARERARAVLSLSNHDLEIIESVELVDEEDLEGSYGSFCEISVDDDDDEGEGE